MQSNAKEAATANWIVQFPEDPTAPTTLSKTTTWQKVSLFIIGAWRLIWSAWVSCHARWSTWDRLGSGPRVSFQAAWFRATILTCLRKLALILIQFKLWLDVQATWDRLDVPLTLRGWGLLTKVYAVGRRGLRWGWSMRWSQDLFFVVFICYILPSMFRSSDTSTPLTHQRPCYQIMRSHSVIDKFPFPYPMDDAAHTAILNGMGWTEIEPVLSNLSNGNHFVFSNLSGLLVRSEEIARYLAYPYLDSEITNLSLSSDIQDLLDRFNSTATPIKVSVEQYDDLEVLYRQQQKITGEAFKRCQSEFGQSWHQTLIRHQPSALKRIGIDFTKWYGLPLQEASRLWEDARLGVAALDQESQRMKQIGYLIEEGKCILDQLATSIDQGDCQFKDNISRQERVQQWLGQVIVSNTGLKEAWDDISMSITDWEALFPVEITEELCAIIEKFHGKNVRV